MIRRHRMLAVGILNIYDRIIVHSHMLLSTLKTSKNKEK